MFSNYNVTILHRASADKTLYQLVHGYTIVIIVIKIITIIITMTFLTIMVIFQRIKRPLQRLLDHAKANIDVIDFRNPQKEVR